MTSKPKQVVENADVDAVCEQLVQHQKMRATYIQGRIKCDNFVAAKMRVYLGYSPTLDKKDQERIKREASETLKKIRDREIVDHKMANLTMKMDLSSDSLLESEKAEMREMVALVDMLPIANWCDEDEQRGFSRNNLAILIGEVGNLNNYDCPSKLCKRFGLWPFNKNGKSQAPSTWMKTKNGGLTKEDWIGIGYCPRRRAIAFNISDPLIKQGQKRATLTDDQKAKNLTVKKPADKVKGELLWVGPYRARYNEARVVAAEKHPDWTDGHLHNHGELMTAKLLIVNLWAEWVKRIPDGQPKSKPWRDPE